MRVEKLRDLIARLHARPRRRLTLLVGVDGPAGAGKTTFTRALTALDPGLDVVQTDDFGQSADETPAEHLVADRPVVDLDWRRLRSAVLLPLSRDQPARYQRYDPTTETLAEWRMVPVGGIVIVEGRYACMKALTTFYDFRIWVDSPREVRMGRLHRANGAAPDQDGALLQADEAYLASQDPAAAAHLRVDGSGALPHDPAREYVRLR